MTIGFYASKLLLMSCRPPKAINIPLQKHVKTINQTMHPFQLMQIRQNIMWIQKVNLFLYVFSQNLPNAFTISLKAASQPNLTSDFL